MEEVHLCDTSGAFSLDKLDSQLKACQGELVEKLKEAQNTRYAKKGEVSILRASMSKQGA